MVIEGLASVIVIWRFSGARRLSEELVGWWWLDSVCRFDREGGDLLEIEMPEQRQRCVDPQ